MVQIQMDSAVLEQGLSPMKLNYKTSKILSNQERKQPIVDPIYEPIVKLLHLFPTFLELEHGLAPSTSEMEVFYECDLPINFCYPQYFSVDHSREEGIIKAAEAFHEKNCIKERRRSHSTRNFGMEQFKAPELDLSIFGDLRQEVVQFLSTSVKGEYNEDSDKDFEDADEDFVEKRETEGFKFNVLMGGVKLKDEEAIKLLKEDLLVAEDIMNEIKNICQVEYSTDEPHLHNAARDGNLQKNQGQDHEMCSAVIDDVKNENLTDIKTEWPDFSDSAENEVDSLIHPLSAMKFEDEANQTDLNYDLRLPDIHLENYKLFVDEENSLSVINRLKLEMDRKISDFINDEVYYDEEQGYLDFTKEEVGSNDEKVEEAKVSTCTNASVRNLSGTIKEDMSPLLRLLQGDKDVGCESSGESSASTTYESPLVIKTQHSWSTFSDMSAETISELGKSLRGSCSSDSFESLQHKKKKEISHHQSIGVQTLIDGNSELSEDAKTCSLQILDSQSVGIQTPMENNEESPCSNEARSCMVRTSNRHSIGIQTPMDGNTEDREQYKNDTKTCVVHATDHQSITIQAPMEGICPYTPMCPSWSEAHYNNPYYTMRYSNVQSFVYEQQYPPRHNDSSGLPPPPGFVPHLTFSGSHNYQPYPQYANTPYRQPTVYYGRPDMPPSQMPPQQYSLPPRMMQGYNQNMPVSPNAAGAPMSTFSDSGSAPRINSDFYNFYNEQQLQK